MKPPVWTLLLILLLAACQSSLVAERSVAPGGLLYRDDFSNPASGWPRSVSTSGSEGYADGSYRMTVNTPQYDLWALPGQTFGDVQVEVDAARISGPDANRFGVVCRYQEPQSFYFFIISSDGYYGIGKTLNGRASLLGQAMMAYNAVILTAAAPKHIRFDCIGSVLIGYVNGQALASAMDPDFSNGEAGLLAGTFDTAGVEISFSSFRVIKP